MLPTRRDSESKPLHWVSQAGCESSETTSVRLLQTLALLEIKNLHVAVNGQEIVRGVDLAVASNEVHAVMGPNGSGKSTLAYALMGHPGYEITE